MNTTTLSDLRANLKSYFDELEDNKDILIVPRSGNKEAIVLMTLSEYNSMKETEYLLSSKNNRELLEKSIKELDGEDTIKFEL
ncbi:type II toxin-antitoxin system prevent-host-death family antitoxin [Flammeovirga yaeyamensis]|uniref:Antitoxin n=1 Tax=Flammeovirga yaeyamensis TaxID=367791 RepID=A0AAX1MXX9_9BACT|nr:type II toxin-antitoxin system Phd/YefM family antitoxin [Flammeovirga yaeyamensis]MBB3696316.1 antitoxin YefM [Flammeovirga yaeyamensis]NMF34995.1 type II toxin-antitoxin system Phd/YefM family antitoxin [Flammeovirga yaeyamensis]QWG00178.1 type II toxin-antitoxin system prevent-host-death family antitoxin [Flammeovirga yaeyamensis]